MYTKHRTVCEMQDDNSVQVHLHRQGNTDHSFSLQGQDQYIQCCLYIILCLKHTTKHCKSKTLFFFPSACCSSLWNSEMIFSSRYSRNQITRVFLNCCWGVSNYPVDNVHSLWSNRRAGLVLMLNTGSAPWNQAIAGATWPLGLQK